MFTLSSPAFKDGKIDSWYGNHGPEENMIDGIPQVSFELSWRGVPLETESFAITMIDFDDSKDDGVPWIHWLAACIPSEVTHLEKNASRTADFLVQGCNSWCTPLEPFAGTPEDLYLHFAGPCPDNPHEYEVWLYALDYMPDLKTGFYYKDLRRAMDGHVTGTAMIKGLYE